MSFLPGAGSAQVEPAKVRTHLLNAAHPQNGGKAGFFELFGFTPAGWTLRWDALRTHPVTSRVASTTTSAHGVEHVVRRQLRTSDGRNPCIKTVWVEEPGRPPRLVAARP